jgi:predicted RNA binding protein YcfA (HicA-like mRNA interferase family)
MAGRKLSATDAREVIRALEKAGFARWRQKGSHLTMFRESDRRSLTVPFHFAKNAPKGTLRTIIRDADLSVMEFVKLLKG